MKLISVNNMNGTILIIRAYTKYEAWDYAKGFLPSFKGYCDLQELKEIYVSVDNQYTDIIDILRIR